MLKIGEDKSISVTRGDSVVFGVSQKSKDGTLRVFNAGDVVRFTVVKKKDYSSVVLQKDFAVEESCEVVYIALTSQETRIGESINKETEYWYEVEVNPGTADTIIGHDVSGAKQFWLYPEAEAIEEPEIKPEDIPVVDDKLDVTSKRPIANDVVARAVLLLEEESDNLSQKVDEMEERIGVLTSRLKNLSTLKEGSTTADAELIGIREGWDGTFYESAGEAVREQIKQAKSAVSAETLEKIDVANQVAEEAMGAANKNAQDLLTLQDILGVYVDDEDIIGLEADFENKTFTRLGAAKGLEAGEDFNRFSTYRDRVRCTVADDGTITSLYGEGGAEWNTICEAEAQFGDYNGDKSEGACDFPTSGEIAYIPHTSYQGAAIKITVTNKSKNSDVTEITSTLGIPGETQTFGEFSASDDTVITLSGFPNGESDPLSYSGGFVLFITPYTSDALDIKIELKTNESAFVDDGTNGQVMVYQPKFYYRVLPTKLEKQEGGLGYHIRKANYYISAKPKPLFKLHPAFYDENGKEIEYILYSAYEGSMWDASMQKYFDDSVDTEKDTDFNEDMLCSVAGTKPISGQHKSIHQGTLEELAQSRGECWHLESIETVSANQLLMLIEFAEFNLDDAVGMGICDAITSSAQNSACSSGLTSSLGNATGQVPVTVGDKIANAVSYRGVENVWGNMRGHINGIGVLGSKEDLTCRPFINGECANFTVAVSDGFVLAFGYGGENYDWLFIPSMVGGSSVLPVGDYFKSVSTYSDKMHGAIYGGGWYEGTYAGPFSFSCNTVSGYSRAHVGGRLVYLPKGASI